MIRSYNLAILLFISSLVVGQNTTRSPYSSFGIGDLETPAFASNISMGGLRFAMAEYNHINISNPASYGLITKPNFNVGIAVNALQLEVGNESQSSTSGYMKNIALAFPIAKWWGLSFGLVPYSKVGYQFLDSETVENLGTVQYNYQGSGGINQIYFGNGFKLLSDSSNTLSLGFNASYLFGNISKEGTIVPAASSGTFNTITINETKISDFKFDLGVHYKRKINKSIAAAFGASYSLGDSLRTFSSELIHTYEGDRSRSTDVIKDTIFYSSDTGNTYLPQSVGVGFVIELSKKKDQYHRQCLFGADYSFTDWSSMSILGNNVSLAKQEQLSLGFQYIPDVKAYKNIQKMINYRLGVRFANTRLIVDGQNLNEYGISFGLGIPIVNSGTGTMFNIGVETGRRGELTDTIIKEQFTNFHIGFSLTPNKFDRWFQKSKIN